MIERKYLTFSELVERWGFDKKDVHYLISEGDLIPSIAWNFSATSCQWEPDSNDGYIHLREVRDEHGFSETIRLNGWVYLQMPNITGPFASYVFSYASYEKTPTRTEFTPGALFRLKCNGEYSHVTGFDIEKEAVFMMDAITDCEIIFHPSIGLALDKKKQDLGEKTPTPKETFEAPEISGATYGRMQRAVAAFPGRYPEYLSKPPKLDDDVRKWLEESGLAKNDAERRVFGAIIREHFKI